MSEIISQIEKRKIKLTEVAKELKQHFVGLDSIIDKIINNITAWYCMNEVLTRPTIVCLWGLTGNGKTDLVRRLVKSLDFSDKFVEIQLSNKSNHNASLQSFLRSSNVSNEEAGILLLDEIQRFRSVDEEGKDVHDHSFQDIWMLLSDGSFGSSSDNKQRIIDMFLDSLFYDDYDKNNKSKNIGETNQEEIQQRKYKLSTWQARQLKDMVKLKDSVEDIMQWTPQKKISVLHERMEDKSIFVPEVYSKLLIFISGNLDEAYSIADKTAETDVDADIFHKNSLNINLLTIKSSLKKRFKPEQIARFGNTHVIYPSLNKSSYEEISKRRIKDIIDEFYKRSGVTIKVDQSVYDVIYRNGVFPAQGTRPLFSTIGSFFESVLPEFIFHTLTAGENQMFIYYEEGHLISKFGKQIKKIKSEGDVDKILEENRNRDKIAKTAVHEAGHSLAYALLFGYAPTQINSLTASTTYGGFIGCHSYETNKEYLLKMIQVLLSGRIAEEMVYGGSYICGGACGDIERATELAMSYLRQYGMGKKLVKQIPYTTGPLYNNDLIYSNEESDKIVRNEYNNAQQLLRTKRNVLKNIVRFLIEQEKVNSQQFVELMAKNNIKIKCLDSKETIVPSYENMFNDWAEKVVK